MTVICQKCGGSGVLLIDKATSLTTIEQNQSPCDLCNGNGELVEDSQTAIMNRLDRIIALLTELLEKLT